MEVTPLLFVFHLLLSWDLMSPTSLPVGGCLAQPKQQVRIRDCLAQPQLQVRTGAVSFNLNYRSGQALPCSTSTIGQNERVLLAQPQPQVRRRGCLAQPQPQVRRRGCLARPQIHVSVQLAPRLKHCFRWGQEAASLNLDYMSGQELFAPAIHMYTSVTYHVLLLILYCMVLQKSYHCFHS
jgi:hypothetical protein